MTSHKRQRMVEHEWIVICLCSIIVKLCLEMYEHRTWFVFLLGGIFTRFYFIYRYNFLLLFIIFIRFPKYKIYHNVIWYGIRNEVTMNIAKNDSKLSDTHSLIDCIFGSIIYCYDLAVTCIENSIKYLPIIQMN